MPHLSPEILRLHFPHPFSYLGAISATKEEKYTYQLCHHKINIMEIPPNDT